MEPQRFSGYRFMWTLVMFDLPTRTKRQRKRATGFRNRLLDLGFEMNQFSVYMKFCPNRTYADTLSGKVGKAVPEEGVVSILTFTDKQYGQMKIFHGAVQESDDRERKQLLLL